MIKVIVDSNYFISDYTLSSNAFKIFSSNCTRLGLELAIPKVVILEVAAHFCSYTASIKSEISTNLKKLQTSTPNLSDDEAMVADRQIQQLGNVNYERWLIGEITKLGGSILPIPIISHEKIVRRDLSLRKPFGGKNCGYRDYLIWESVVKVLQDGSKVAFITQNCHDFFRDNRIHEDLLEDLKEREIRPSYLTTFNSLRSFSTDFIEPKLKILGNIKEKIESGKFHDLNLDKWISFAIPQLVDPDDFKKEITNIPRSLGFSTLVVNEVRSKALESILEVSPAEILIVFHAVVIVELEISARLNEIQKCEEAIQLFQDIRSSNFEFQSLFIEYEIRFKGKIVYNTKTKRVVTSEITDYKLNNR